MGKTAWCQELLWAALFSDPGSGSPCLAGGSEETPWQPSPNCNTLPPPPPDPLPPPPPQMGANWAASPDPVTWHPALGPACSAGTARLVRSVRAQPCGLCPIHSSDSASDTRGHPILLPWGWEHTSDQGERSPGFKVEVAGPEGRRREAGAGALAQQSRVLAGAQAEGQQVQPGPRPPPQGSLKPPPAVCSRQPLGGVLLQLQRLLSCHLALAPPPVVPLSLCHPHGLAPAAQVG